MLGMGASANGLPLIVNLSPQMAILIVAACCLSLPLWPRLRYAFKPISANEAAVTVILLSRAALIAAAMVLCLSVMAGQQYIPFIYFRF